MESVKKFVINLKLLFMIILVFSVILVSSSINASSYSIKDYRIDAKIMANGNMHVEEYLKYYFSEDMNGVYRDILYKYTFNGQKDNIEATSSRYQAEDIVNLKVYTSNKSFNTLEESTLALGYTPYNGNDGVYTAIDNLNDGYVKNIKVFSPVDAGKYKYVKYEYDIENVAVKYNNAGEIYWNFLGDDWDVVINNLNINITFENQTASPENIKVYPHSYTKELTSRVDNNNIYIQAKNVDSNIAVDARVVFPVDVLSYADKTIAEDYDYSLLNKVEEEMSKGRERYFLSNNLSLIILLCGIVGLVTIIIESNKIINKGKKKGKKIEICSDILEKYSLGEYSCILNTYGGYGNTNLLLATILDLSDRKYIVMEPEKKLEVSKFDKIEYNYNMKLNSDKDYSTLNEFEINIINYLFNGKLGNVTNLTNFKYTSFELNDRLKELSKNSSEIMKYVTYCKDKNVEASKKIYNDVPKNLIKFVAIYVIAFIIVLVINLFVISPVLSDMSVGILSVCIFIGIFAAVFISSARSLKEEYLDDYNKLVGLKKYLTEYSTLKERYPIEIALWNKYLVFAALFGIADKVGKEFKEELIAQGYDEEGIYLNYPYVGISIYSPQINQSFATSTGSSSSGGYSGSGSGGGGGRRRRWRSLLKIKYISLKNVKYIIMEVFNMSKIKVAQYGCGKMSVYTMRYVYEKGAEIVAAFDIDESKFGKDISTLMGGEEKGVKISNVKDAEAILTETKPDICIITTMSLFKDVYDAFEICAKLGINAISTCEEAFFPMNSNPTLTKKLDELAKETGCTLTGAGYQDVYWGNLIATIAGSTHKITKIKGSSSYNVEDYGIALAKAHGSGLTLEEFDKEVASVDKVTDEERKRVIESGEYLPSYMWNVNGWLAAKLGLHITHQTQVTIPTTHEKDLNSSTLGMVVKAGDATGMSAVVTSQTEEGIVIESECIGKVYAEDEFDKNEWTVYGEPDTTVVINKPATVELTCATIVNRIPDVINARPGFVPTEEMPVLEYRTKSLDSYLK